MVKPGGPAMLLPRCSEVHDPRGMGAHLTSAAHAPQPVGAARGPRRMSVEREHAISDLDLIDPGRRAEAVLDDIGAARRRGCTAMARSPTVHSKGTTESSTKADDRADQLPRLRCRTTGTSPPSASRARRRR